MQEKSFQNSSYWWWSKVFRISEVSLLSFTLLCLSSLWFSTFCICFYIKPPTRFGVVILKWWLFAKKVLHMNEMLNDRDVTGKAVLKTWSLSSSGLYLKLLIFPSFEWILFFRLCQLFVTLHDFADEMSLGARGRYKDRTPSVTHSPEIMDPSELQPFSKPEVALTEALTLLADDDW